MALRDIRDRVGVVRSRFDTRQNRSVDAFLDDWNSEGENSFIFPVVDGPPGTGKTSVGVIAAAECMLEQRDEQIIYLCYGHFATDVARQKLFELGFGSDQVVRLTPDPRETEWARGIVGCSYNLSDLDHNTLRRLQRCGVLLCTLHGSGRAFGVRGVRGTGARVRHTCRVVVDEFSQVPPPLWFASLIRARDVDLNPTSYALLGDPYQLPVVTTQPLLQENVGEFVGRVSGGGLHELRTQHRMHEDICDAVNSLRDALQCPYRLESAEAVRRRDLTHPELNFRWNENACPQDLREIVSPSYPFVIVDTSGLGREERCFGGSLRNDDEAELATRIAMAIYESYSRNGRRLTPSEPSDFKVLSPYSGQVGSIQQRLPPELRGFCTTIYRSQGREYPCVIISFVWNDPNGFIGFLQDPRLRAQTYVGCSRAQGKLVALLSHRCFQGHRDFDYLCRTASAHRVEARPQ